MARNRASGSPTKEFPITNVDATINAITPGMSYADLRTWAKSNTHVDIPGVLKKRFLLIQEGQIQYDLLLSLARAEGLNSPRIRKILYFLWMYRSEPHRRFICEVVADGHGHWRPAQLRRKQNATFFENFYSPSTAVKARSNIEYFLTEVGIFNPNDNSVHLELEDGWLADAVRVASQHEQTSARRHAMLSNPAQFLITNGWHGLANASPDELRNVPLALGADEDPLADEALGEEGPRRSGSRPWNRPAPTPATRRAATVSRDPVRVERANSAHHRLEVILNNAIRAKGLIPQTNEHIDMHFGPRGGAVLAEMKSCHQNNLHAQVRRGVSQLLEYRYVYREELGDDVTLLLVLETRPAERKAWLVDYARSLEILVAWKDPAADRVVTTEPVPTVLDGIVTPI